MNNQQKFIQNWIIWGIAAGFFTGLIYPLLIFVPLPEFVSLPLVAAFGPGLIISSVGLYYFLKIHRHTVTSQMAVLFNIIAGTLLSVMIIVQLAIRDKMPALSSFDTTDSIQAALRNLWLGLDNVQLGLDIAWDVYLVFGTFFFALNMVKHPRLGKIIGLSGMTIAALLFVMNLYTFPQPPGEAGLFDFGPITGLWYLTAGVCILFSLRWVKEQIRKTEV